MIERRKGNILARSKKRKEAVLKVLKSAIRVTLNSFQDLIIRKMRSRNKFGMTLFHTFQTAFLFFSSKFSKSQYK